MNYPHRATKWLLELMFPHRCVACGRFCGQEYLCRQCFNAMPIKKQSECVGCKRPAADGRTCMFCKGENPLDRLFIASDFKDPIVAVAVKRMKYSFLQELIEPLHDLTRKYLKARAIKHDSFLEGSPLLVPVPLHPRRKNWRGFDQASLLAERLAIAYQLPLVSVMRRTVFRGPQAEISDRDSRLANARGLYVCVDPIAVQDRNVMLIDDVCTTGATLNECARILKDAGARSVSALVIARG